MTILNIYFRAIRRKLFLIMRFIVFSFFRLWVRSIHGKENLPLKGPALVISNHSSYYDFFILGTFFSKPEAFVASAHLKEHPIVRWFEKFDSLIYIDREKPGYKFFREIIRHLSLGKLVVIYPEGKRSRTGRILRPKTGFVKLALIANVPIIPVGMKGTYEILPPQMKFPRFKRCEIFFNKKIYISPQNQMFKDIFLMKKSGRLENVTEDQMQLMADRIMESVRALIGGQWDDDCHPKTTTLLPSN